MGLFQLFKQKSYNETENTFEKDAVFEHILKVLFRFKGRYPDKIVSIGVYPSKRITGYVAFDITFILDGNINYFHSTEASEMLEFFKLIEDDGSFQTFECTHNTFEEANSYAYVNQKTKEYVKYFMKENPSRNFDLSGAGATIMFW